MYLSVNQAIDPYFCTTLGTVIESMKNGRISIAEFGGFQYDPDESGHLGYQAVIMSISAVAGVDPVTVAFLPIGGFLVPLTFFVLARRVLKSTLIAALLAILIAYDPSMLPGHYSVFAYAWERPLLFTFVFAILVTMQGNRRLSGHLLMIVIFFGTFSIYWTTPFVMVVFLLTVSIIDRIGRRELKTRAGGTMISIAGAFAIIYLAFSRILYRDFIPSVVSEKYGTFEDALQEMAGWIGLGNIQHLDPYEVTASAGSTYNMALLIRYLIIAIPIIAYGFYYTLKIAGRKPVRLDTPTYFFLPSLVAGFAQTIGYAFRGHLSLRFIFLLAPIASVISMERMNLRRFRIVPVALALIIVVTLFPVSIIGNSYRTGIMESTEAGAEFAFKTIDPSEDILMDLYTYGVYLVRGVSSNEDISVNFYTSDVYYELLGVTSPINETAGSFSYVIIDLSIADATTAAPNWKSYEPLSWYFEEVENNPRLNKVYDDQSTWIFAAY